MTPLSGICSGSIRRWPELNVRRSTEEDFIRFGAGKNFTPYMMTDAELTSFFAEADKLQNTSVDILRRCTAAVMLRLIYTCGLRPGEGLRLKNKNINLDTGEILIMETKLKKERIVVMHEDMQKKLMRKYAMKVSLSGRDHTVFFPDPNGQPHTTGWLDNIVKTCFYRAHPGISPETLPQIRAYDLRHTYAVTSLQEGDDIKTVQQNLSHATASFTLDVYGHVSEKMKQESAARMERFIEKIKAKKAVKGQLKGQTSF